MELQKKSELTLGRSSFVISTELSGDPEPSIETRVLGSDGVLVFATSQDISELKPLIQNSQEVFARLEAQHQRVSRDLEQGRIPPGGAGGDRESDALAHAVDLLGKRSFDKAAAALRAVLETYPNCSEARELLEVVYKASSDARLPVEIEACLERGTEAFAGGRQRDAIESWKQCLIEEPDNRRLQLLVLLSTTWSQERRRRYAAEVLAPGNRILSGGRAEEAQALLVATQSVDGGKDESPSAEAANRTAFIPSSPPGSPEPDEDRPIDASDLESLVASLETPESDVERTVLTAAPEPPGPAPAKPAAEPPRPASASPAPPPSPTAPKPAPETRSSATQRAIRPRRPPPPARRGAPWGILGAVAAVAVLAGGGAALWLLSGDQSIPPARLEEAAGLASTGQFAQAIGVYERLVAEFGETAVLLLGRGRARLASGDTAGGLVDLEGAHALDPESPAIAEEIADVLYSQDRFPEAIGYYEKAFAKGGGTAEGRYRIGVSLVREGRAEDAMTHLQSAIAKEPSHGEAQFLYGQLLNDSARYEEAESVLRAAEPNLEAGSDYLHQLGIALLEQQKLDQAEEAARSFLRSYPNDARARSLLGEVYLGRKQYEPARDQLILALRTDPREPRAQIALGRTWLAIGKARGDVQDLGKAQQVLATARGVHEGRRLLALGQVSLAEGKLDAARDLLQRSLERGAPGLAVHLSLAETKWRADDVAGAAEELQRASGLAPGDPAISLSLALAYFQLKDPARAADQFLKALQGIGVVAPPGEGSGPIVLPEPYVPLPDRFNINRAIRDSYQNVLQQIEDDPTATQLRSLSESATFLVGAGG